MASTEEHIATRASYKLGATAINDFENPTKNEERVFANLFEDTYRRALAETNWRFAIADQNLNRKAAAPDDPRFDYNFELPADYIFQVAAFTENGTELVRERDYQIQNDELLSNLDTVVLKYVKRPDVTRLPPWFTAYLVDLLAYEASQVLKSNTQLSDLIRADMLRTQQAAHLTNAHEGPRSRAQITGTFRRVRGS